MVMRHADFAAIRNDVAEAIVLFLFLIGAELTSEWVTLDGLTALGHAEFLSWQGRPDRDAVPLGERSRPGLIHSRGPCRE